jgi:hypothetical protein|tara:strand:- start:982 stop:1215 length:234 start_codon:yes stop_codon:yes gene_type:complete
MPLTNPSGQIYSNMKALTAKLRDSNSTKASENTKKDGIMLRRSMGNIQSSESSPELEENIKIAKILMKIEDERNGTA